MFRYLLYPLTLMFSAITKIRNIMYDNGVLSSIEFNIPILCVGNITVGGTGKTPHVEYLAKLLKNENSVATLSRGYKRKTKGFLLATDSTGVNEIGDEPRQIKLNNPEIEVAVCENRVTGVEKLLEHNKNINTILLDDAFQHRRIKAGLSILLVDFNRPIYNDQIMPVGRLRESAVEKRRAHVIIVTKCPDDLKPIDRRIIAKNMDLFPFQSIYFTKIKYNNLKTVYSNTQEINEIRNLNKFSIVLFTGIANATGIKNYLSQFSKEILHINFPDHHNFKQKDILKITETFENIPGKEKILVTTQKDAVRIMEMKQLSENFRNNLYYLPIEVEFLFDEQEIFNKQIIDYVRNYQTNSKFYSTKRQL